MQCLILFFAGQTLHVSAQRWLQLTGETQALVKSYAWLGDDKTEYCSTVPEPPPILDEQDDYPPVPHEDQENFESRTLIQSYRKENQLKKVFQVCSFGEDPLEDKEACSKAMGEYTNSLSIFATPLVVVLFTLLTWHVCCWVSCCRCCRRCCLCAERKGPRDARIWQQALAALSVFICTGAIFFLAIIAYSRSTQMSDGIADMLCQMLTLADEMLNGSNSGPIFLGIDVGIHKIQMLRRLLDVDGRAMTDVRAILDDTATFAAAMDDVLTKINHMERVLTIVGQRKLKEHSCVFCQLAVGNNATGVLGLLPELKLEIERSSADAMRQIQTKVSSTLTGRSLVDVSNSVQRGGTALQVFKAGFSGTFVEGFGSHKDSIRTYEDARHTFFMAMAGFCIIHALFVSIPAIYYAKSSKSKYPSPTPSCLSWFCAFCSMSAALLFAAILILVVVPVSELCYFTRHDLLTYPGINDYHRQLGFFSIGGTYPKDAIAVNVARTCLTPNGTGDILGALDLRAKLQFQQVLDDKFVELEDKMAGKVIDIAKFELLVSRSISFGGLFQLEPDDPKPLDAQAQSVLLGSSVEPDDQQGPRGETELIAGLNTYASLIAGAGKFSFFHGTAGGGTLITTTRPTEVEMQAYPVQVQNALIYARLKEQILSETDLFRCDVIDSRYRVTERKCGYEEYKGMVQQWAQDIKEAGVKLGDEAQRAKQLIADDLKTSLKSILVEVRELRTLFRCRFAWKRWEDFDFALCNQCLPGALQGAVIWLILAIFTLVLLVIHYKTWRHFLDNKIVGTELERFSKKYGYLQTK